MESWVNSELKLKPNILVSPDSSSWASLAASSIGKAMNLAIASRGVCHVMLTGGKTAEGLYEYCSKTAALPLKDVRFMFGDERCVPPDHSESNYALVMKTLLARGVPPGCSIVRMEAEDPDREAAAKAYEKLIPEKVDVLLLGMGTDGHIASLFPNSPALTSGERNVLPITGPKPPSERLTITPGVITRARSVFVLATGKEKGNVLGEALKSMEDFRSLPVRLALGGTWLLDAEAEAQISNYK
jgi:6-phosphogluconolactonase